MSASSDSSAHADYLFNRDKGLKKGLENTNRNSRIVPEVSGKKRLTESVLTEKKKEVDDYNEVVEEEITDEYDEEKLDIVLYLRENKQFISNEDKETCFKILEEDMKKSHNYMNFILISIITLLIGLFLGKKM